MSELAQTSLRHEESSSIYLPKSFQEEGILHLLENPNGGLFFTPGLGKTAITLQAFVILQKEKAVRNALVVAPIRVAQNVWPAEVEKWVNFRHLSYVVLHGPKKNQLVNEDVDLYFCNPEGLAWLATTDLFKRVDMLIVDESQKFRNSQTQRFRTIRKAIPKFKRRAILTGTPTPNGLMQLWSQMFILDGGNRLGKTLSEFRRRYFRPLHRPGFTEWELLDGAAEQISVAVSDVIMHKDVRVLAEMPDLVNNTIRVTPGEIALGQYAELKKRFVIELENSEVSAFSSGALANKLKQMSSGTVYGDEGEHVAVFDAKYLALRDLIEDEGGRPVIVFYQYNHELARLKEEVADAPHIGGGMTRKKIAEVLRAWDNNEMPVLYAHPQAAGLGLNMQGSECTSVVWFSIPWDLEFYTQGIARIWRQGQKASKIVVHHLVAEQTMDEQVLQALMMKENVQEYLMKSLTGKQATSGRAALEQ